MPIPRTKFFHPKLKSLLNKKDHPLLHFLIFFLIFIYIFQQVVWAADPQVLFSASESMQSEISPEITQESSLINEDSLTETSTDFLNETLTLTPAEDNPAEATEAADTLEESPSERDSDANDFSPYTPLETLSFSDLDPENPTEILPGDEIHEAGERVSVLKPLEILNQIPREIQEPQLTVDYVLDGIRKQQTFSLKDGYNNIMIREKNASGEEEVWGYSVFHQAGEPDSAEEDSQVEETEENQAEQAGDNVSEISETQGDQTNDNVAETNETQAEESVIETLPEKPVNPVGAAEGEGASSKMLPDVSNPTLTPLPLTSAGTKPEMQFLQDQILIQYDDPNTPLGDVNGDGYRTAGDALEIINYINAFGSGLVKEGYSRLDVNKDGYISAGDSLLVINYLNSFGAVQTVETVNFLQAFANGLVFSLDNGGSNVTEAYLEITDISGKKSGVVLTGINDNQQRWKISLMQFEGIDLTKVKSLSLKNLTSTTQKLNFIWDPMLLDTTPPQGTIRINKGLLYTSQLNASLTLSATDIATGMDKMSFSNDGITWTTPEAYSSVKSWTFPAGEGNKTVYVKFSDKAGQWSQPISAAVFLDTGGPKGSLAIQNGQTVTASSHLILNLSAQDSGSGVSTMSFSTDGLNWSEPEPYAASKNFTLPAGDGNKTIYVKYFDKAGWVSAVYSKSILLDTAAPAGDFTINQGETYTKNQAVNLEINVSDTGSGMDQMSFAINTTDPAAFSSWESYTSTKTLTLPNYQGPNYINIKLRDKAGNEIFLWKSIILDSTIPSGSLSINADAVSTNNRDVTLSLTATDNTSGVDQMRISVDNGLTWSVWENFAGSKNLTLPDGNGTKVVQYQVKDKAGNSSQIYSKSIEYMAAIAPPTVQFTSSQTSESFDYVLKYTVNGNPYEETWHLAPGENDLLTRIVFNDSVTFARQKVTVSQSVASFPPMPAIPELPADSISLTTASGEILKYSQGSLIAVEKTNEYQLFFPEMDADGNLIGGVLRYSNGNQVLLKDAKPYYAVSASGEKTLYDASGNVQLFETSDGKRTHFAYRKDAHSGEIIATLSFEPSATSLYENGFPAWVVMEDGTEIRYEDGFLKEYRDSSGNRFNYSTQKIQENGVTTGYISQLVSVMPSGSFVSIPIGNILNSLSNYPSIKGTLEQKLALSLEYDAQKQMKKFTSGKNEILQIQNGLPVSLKDSLGQVTSIQVANTPGGGAASMTLVQNNLEQTYDDSGKLSAITLSDGTQLKVKAQQLAEIDLSDGSILTGLKWNGSVLVDFVRTRPDGSKEIYQEQNLIRKEETSGAVTTYIHLNGADHPDLMTFPDGRTYHFIEYQNGQGLSDRIMELVSMDLGEGSRIEFENGKPVRYIQKKQVQLDPASIPELPAGQSYIPSLVLPAGELRAVTVNSDATILAGEILFNDGTQYFIENGQLTKQITPDGKIIVASNQTMQPVQTFAAVPVQPLNLEETAYKNQLMDVQLHYFINGIGIDPVTGFPMDNYNASTSTQSTYSQTTLVGMWAEILAAIAKGDYVTSQISALEAYQNLQKILKNLSDVQDQAGWNGMFSFFSVTQESIPILDEVGKPTGETKTVNVYKRQFSDIGIGDNLNLSVSLSSVMGAISKTDNPATNALRDSIVNLASGILSKQLPGYDQYYDPQTKRFRMAYQFNGNGTGQFTGYMDRVFNEFRTGLIWLAAQNPAYKEAVQNLDVAIRPYETSEGIKIDNTVPFDGGAFQMFWPLIHVDETQYPEFDVALKNFLYSQADFVKQNNVPGLISAGDDPGKGYNGKMGLPGASETDDPLQTKVGSLYGTASAFLLAPHYVLQFFKNLENAFPEIRSNFGYVDSLILKEGTPALSQQYFGVDQASLILSLLGTSQNYFSDYLKQQGIQENFDNIYRSMSFGLTPVAANNPLPPDFNLAKAERLFEGDNPDGYSHALVKQSSFISTLIDPELGEGHLYDYLTPSGQFHHTEIEFGSKKTSLQEYLLLPGRANAARSLSEAFKYDLLNESATQGVFYTLGQGYANSSLVVDRDLGEIRQLDFDFKAISRPVGLWAKYNATDLSQYDYLSLPFKLGENTPPGIRLKIELKGMGEIYVTPAATSEWQFLQIPISKPAGLLTEVAISLQTPDNAPAKGNILLGPFAGFKIRTSNQIDWSLTLGKTDTELRDLLKQTAAKQPGFVGGKVEAEEILENFTLDHDGKLVSGILHRADGGIQYFQNGQLVKWIFPNGRTALFEKGLATFILDLAQGKLEEERFYYDQKLNGEIRSFVLQDNDNKRSFSADGRLQSIVEDGRILQFKEGAIDTITLPNAVLSKLLFGDDGNLLKAHVKMNDDREFDIDQTSSSQMVTRPNGVKIYYEGDRIVAIDTPENGRTDFEYSFNASGQLMGVDAKFIETTKDPSTGDPVFVSHMLSLAAYIQRPERSVETSEIIQGSPLSIFPNASIGGFSVGAISEPEMTYALPTASISSNNGFGLMREMAQGLQPGDAMGYLFQYQNINGALMGASIKHTNRPVALSNYSFVAITLRQDPSMNWNQDFTLDLKTAQHATLYNFQLQNATTEPQTFAFPLAGKSGNEAEIGLEVIREADGVGKKGKIYVQDISYFNLKQLEKPLWEDILSLSRSELQGMYEKSKILTAVGGEVASKKPLVYSGLASYLDLPSWIMYADQSPEQTGQLTSFKRFDGSQVFVDSQQNVTRMILPDGTVNEYSQNGNTAQSIIRGPSEDPLQNNQADYHYGALRSITQPDGQKLDFSYEFDGDGNEITVIKNNVNGDERRFKDGNLIQSNSSDKLQTQYGYSEGNLASADLVYKNQVLESTQYHYVDDETLITDDRGTTWYYDKNGNLIKHLTKDGYLFEYADYTQTPDPSRTIDPDDFKNQIYTASDLKSLRLSGYETQDGSQVLFSADGTNEIKLATGEHAVNVVFGEGGKIKSGEIQFADGGILVIDHYIPVSGRRTDGSVFTMNYPEGSEGQILLDEQGNFKSIEMDLAGKKYFYDIEGKLTQIIYPDNRIFDFTYTADLQNKITDYQTTEKSRLSFRGVPFPSAVDLVSQGSGDSRTLRLVAEGQEIVQQSGANGFVVGILKSNGDWDFLKGSLSSAADRFSLKSFLGQIKEGEYVAASFSDASLGSFGSSSEREEIYALFEALGAGQIRNAASSGQDWTLFGAKGFNSGEGSETLNARGSDNTISSEIRKLSSASISDVTSAKYEDAFLLLNASPREFQEWAQFVGHYEAHKPDPEMQAISVYNSRDELVYARRVDGIVSYYEGGKIKEVYAETGELLYRYSYDAEGNQSRIEVVQAKVDFAERIAKLRAQIEQEKFDALYKLAWQDDAARQKIQEEVQKGLDLINSQISNLESMRFMDVKQCHKGFLGIGKSCQHFTVEVPGVQDAINTLYSKKSELLQTQESELSKIANEVSSKRTEIETTLTDQLKELDEQEKQFYDSMLHQEMDPILIDHYRRILGRDPSSDEIKQWIQKYQASGVIDTVYLTNALIGSSERQEKINDKKAIIDYVQNFLQNYLAASDNAARQDLLNPLGLKLSETVSLDASEVSDILAWLTSRDLHFGQSAFLALKEMLRSQGVEVGMRELGQTSVLIDILVGVINPFTEGELLLSMFALNRTAALYGKESVGAHYSYEDLKAHFAAHPGAEMIAHVGEDHYVVVTSASDTEVTYLEMNKGLQGESVTLSREDFLKIWQGNLMVAKADVIEAQQLSVAQTQKIKGAFFFLIPFIIAAIIKAAVLIVYTVVHFILTAVYLAISTIMTQVVHAVSFAFSQIQQGISLIGKGILDAGKLLYQGIKYVGRFVMKGFQFVKEGFSQGLSNLGKGMTNLKNFLLQPNGKPIVDALGHNLFDAQGNILRQFSTQQVVARHLVSAGLNFGASKGLEGMGLNPTLANLVGAFTGSGFLGVGNATAGFLKSGLQGLMLQGVSEMGLKLNLPPPVANALSLLTKSSLNAWFDPDLTLKQSLTQIIPQVSKEFVFGGVELLGRSLGLDWRITALIGTPIRVGLGGFFDSLGYANGINPTSIFAAIKNGLAAGAASIGFDFSGKTADAIFGSLKSGNVLGAVESTLGKNGLFSDIFKVLQQAVLSPFNAVSGAVYAALNGLTDFGSLIQSKGIIGAFESLATSIFSRQTIERLLGSGGISGVLGTAAKVLTTLDGQSVQEQNLGGGTSLFYDLVGNFIGKKENGATQIGTFGVNAQGKWGLLTGKLITTLLGDLVFAGEISNGQLMRGTLSGPTGTIGVFNPEGGEGPIIINGPDDGPSNSGGSFWNAIFKLLPYAMDFVFKQGNLQKTNVQVPPQECSESSGCSISSDPNKLLYLLVNGVNNKDATLGTITPPNYYVQLRNDLVEVDPNIDPNKDVAIASIYPNLKLPGDDWIQNTTIDDTARAELRKFINRFKDVIALRFEADLKAIPGFLVSSILAQAGPFGTASRPVQGLGYSGGFAPMIEAMSFGGMQTEMIAGVGAATLDLTKFRDVLGMTVQTLSSLLDGRVLTQNAPDWINEAKNALTNYYNFAVTKIPVLGPIIGAIGSIISSIFSIGKSAIDIVLDAVKKVFDIFSDLMEKIKVQALLDAQPLVGLVNLQGQAKGVLNIYGDKDLVADLGIGGYRSSIAGFSGSNLINIQIKSQRGAIADHYIYMHEIRSENDYLDAGAQGAIQRDFDDKVADFVAQLFVAGTDPVKADEFLLRPELQPYIQRNADGIYEFYPFGIAAGVS